jgi:hypothetical protein
MAVKRYTEDQLALFAHDIAELAEKLDVRRFFESNPKDSPVAKIAHEAGTLFYILAQQQSPYDTGTLHDAHRRETSIESPFQATSSIFIDPSPSIINPKYGGYPGQYGPEYHDERRAWFDEAANIMQDSFDSIIINQVDIMLETFW